MGASANQDAAPSRELQRFDQGACRWWHVDEVDERVLDPLVEQVSVPTAVLDAVRAAPTHPRRVVLDGWTVWTIQLVQAETNVFSLVVDHLTIAVHQDDVVTVGTLPTALVARGDGGPDPSTDDASAGAVVALILGDLVEDVSEIIERLEDQFQDIEEEVFAPGRGSHGERIYRLKRDAQTIRRSIAPLPEFLADAEHAAQAERSSDGDASGDVPENEIASDAVAEVGTRARRLVEQLSHVDDLLDGVLAAHLTLVSIQQNDDMRRISAWVAIAAAPTAIAGIYGMNFQFMPELDWPMGYPLAIAVMALVCVVLYRLFRRSGWL